MANAAINAGIYQAAHALSMTIGSPSTSWAIATPVAGMGGAPTSGGTVAGYALQGRLGSAGYAAPGTPVETLRWYFVPTSATLSAGQRLTYGSDTFTVVGLAAQMGHYEVERA